MFGLLVGKKVLSEVAPLVEASPSYARTGGNSAGMYAGGGLPALDVTPTPGGVWAGGATTHAGIPMPRRRRKFATPGGVMGLAASHLAQNPDMMGGLTGLPEPSYRPIPQHPFLRGPFSGVLSRFGGGSLWGRMAPMIQDSWASRLRTSYPDIYGPPSGYSRLSRDYADNYGRPASPIDYSRARF